MKFFNWYKFSKYYYDVGHTVKDPNNPPLSYIVTDSGNVIAKKNPENQAHNVLFGNQWSLTIASGRFDPTTNELSLHVFNTTSFSSEMIKEIVLEKFGNNVRLESVSAS